MISFLDNISCKHR